MNRYVIAVMTAVVLAGCASTQPTQAPIDDKSAAAGSTPSTGAGASTSGTTGSGVSGATTSSGTTGSGAMDPLRDPANVLSKRSIYFELDSFVVEEQYKPIVEAHARYLVSNRNARMTVQGHGDERGSREYNIALGQKRSDAVKRMMTLLGAQEMQVETVSFGEEKPRNTGSGEQAWTENRRVDILYAGE